MNHDIVIDENGNVHQAVKSSSVKYGCLSCSLSGLVDCMGAPCVHWKREDKEEAIYKRKVTIEEYINAKQNR